MKVKISLIIIFVFFLLGGNLFAQYSKDKPATHGMLLMGTETVYASHLPMFHSPHDYQILLLLKFDNDGMSKYQEDRKAHSEVLVYTIEPEVFVLPQMVNKIKKFKGTIYRGHFERGGEVIAKDVDVVIDRVIYFNRFKSSAKKLIHLKYILFGNSKEQFLVHMISARPDFDEIISVKLKNHDTKLMQSSSYLILDSEEKDERKGYSWRNNSLGMKGNIPIEFDDHQVIYFEIGDLE